MSPVRMWRNRNPCALLVGMQNGTATVENNMEMSLKIKNRTIYDAIPILDIYVKELKSGAQKAISIFMCSLQHYAQ